MSSGGMELIVWPNNTILRASNHGVCSVEI